MEIDLTEAIETGAAPLWYDANPDHPIRDCDEWDLCKALARRAIEAARPDIERAVREQVAKDIETELAAAIRGNPDRRTRSPRQEMAYRVSAHIARGGACVANPKGVSNTALATKEDQNDAHR